MKDIRICDNSNIHTAIKLCHKYNIGIEVQEYHNPYITNENTNIIEEHAIILNKLNHKKSLHAPFWDLNIGSKIIDIKNITLKLYEESYKLALKLGCSDIVVHNGYIPNTYHEEAWVGRAYNAWHEFLIGKYNMNFYIENQFEDYDILCKVVDQVNRYNFKICLDIGHVNAHSKVDIIDWIRNCNHRIGYVHIHNNYKIKDDHNGIEKGNIEIYKVLDELNKYSPKAIWSLETNEEDIEDSYLKIRNRYL